MSILRGAALTAAALLLQSCFFAPGKFSSTLELRRGGQFSFAYTGEVLFADHLGGAGGGPQLQEKCWGAAPKKEGAGSAAAVPSVTVRTIPPGESAAASEMAQAELQVQTAERPCTPAEQAANKARFERERREQAVAMGAVFGFNPYDPVSVRAFTDELRKYRGWRAVTHKGGNRFQVDYRVSGALSQDLVFPVFEGVLVHTPFVVVRPRVDGSVDVRAPAFGAQAGWGSLTGMAAFGGAVGQSDERLGDLLKSTDGTFTIVTDGEVRTNNTAEGPGQRGAERVLTWRVTALTRDTPRALIGLGS